MTAPRGSKVAKPVVKCPRASRSAKPGGSVLLGAPGAGEGTPAEIYQRTRLRAHPLKFPGCIEAKTGDGSGAFPRTASANNCKQIVNLRKALPPLIN